MLKAIVLYPDLRAQLARELVLARLEREARLRLAIKHHKREVVREVYRWQVRSLIRAFEHLEDRRIHEERERSRATVDRIVGAREMRARELHQMTLYAGAAAA
ncbi:MAG TPA: hypothetical protein PLC98_03680 [Anaerolineales bacterium]|nr:hypothetical protein [Anaerolineales bacterium]